MEEDFKLPDIKLLDSSSANYLVNLDGDLAKLNQAGILLSQHLDQLLQSEGSEYCIKFFKSKGLVVHSVTEGPSGYLTLSSPTPENQARFKEVFLEWQNGQKKRLEPFMHRKALYLGARAKYVSAAAEFSKIEPLATINPLYETLDIFVMKHDMVHNVKFERTASAYVLLMGSPTPFLPNHMDPSKFDTKTRGLIENYALQRQTNLYAVSNPCNNLDIDLLAKSAAEKLYLQLITCDAIKH